MAFADKVSDYPADPTVWITEDLNDDPDEELAPYSIRVVWYVHRRNARRVIVQAKSVDRIQDGAKSGRSHNIPDSVPREHFRDMIRKVQIDILKNKSTEQVIQFPQWDEEITVDPTPVDPEEAREGHS